MAEYAPDERAQALADRIMGKRSADAEAIDTIAKGIRFGQHPATEKQEDEQRQENEPRKHQETEEGEDAYEYRSDNDDDEEETGSDTDADDRADDEPDEENDDQDDGEEYEEVAYSDDDEIEVTVDGEKRTATLRELKKAFSGEGAIEKRLKEATEARTAANAERAAAQQEVQQHRANLLRTIQQLDGVLFQPLFNKPDPKLRQRNMNEYLAQKDAYDEDQERIKLSRESLVKFFNQEKDAMAKARQEFRANEMAKLVDAIPEIKDETKAQRVYEDIMKAVAHYGFTPEQVAEVDHHGVFLMARDAARWLNMQKLKSNGGPRPEKMVRKRRLKAGSGSVTGNKIKAVASQKQQRAAETKAARTGKVDDVAAMLVAKARVKGSPNGRRGTNR